MKKCINDILPSEKKAKSTCSEIKNKKGKVEVLVGKAVPILMWNKGNSQFI